MIISGKKNCKIWDAKFWQNNFAPKGFIQSLSGGQRRNNKKFFHLWEVISIVLMNTSLSSLTQSLRRFPTHSFSYFRGIDSSQYSHPGIIILSNYNVQLSAASVHCNCFVIIAWSSVATLHRYWRVVGISEACREKISFYLASKSLLFMLSLSVLLHGYPSGKKKKLLLLQPTQASTNHRISSPWFFRPKAG